MTLTVIEDRPFFPWGVKLYPSGEFVLWRKKRESKQSQKESLRAACSWLYNPASVGEVFRLYGPSAVLRLWGAAEEVDVSRVSRGEGSAVIPSVAGGVMGPRCLLGLSAHANSEKKRRGLGGLTSHGKVLVRESAFALQERYGKWRLSFWTCTLPQLSPRDTTAVCKNWSKLLENLKAKLKYHLESRGLPTHIVGVTELQPSRWRSWGYPAWHIHWLFVGKGNSGGWAVTPELGDKLWKEAVEAYCEESYDFGKSCRIEPIRKSAAGYMAKYMSKGSAAVQEVESVYPGCVPSSWYVVTSGLRRWVKVCTRSSEVVARYIHQMLQDSIEAIVAPWAFRLETRPGCHVAVCWLGRIPDPPDYVIRLT